MSIVIGIMLGVVAVPGLQLELRAARGEGRSGVFVAEQLTCGVRGGCQWRGSYRSDDGKIERRNAWIYGYGEFELSEGDRVPALDVGHDVKLYKPGSLPLPDIIAVSLVLLLAAVLVLWPCCLLLRRVRNEGGAGSRGLPSGGGRSE
ncbi:hypothetical protein MF672_036120 [Actinomadura sp. ATCC 31491]|uniref:DUF3592 domain-containing protein n=1 Tax=Actinomadura luzonensis TaxID=2805427 RepID=A0ABT0G4Z9_9ACTN|nr:hypothetical protein [Actinomadura luzonensis]MCK2219181.1 hypothetical protein [Actinomadura luzonensis]